MSNATAVFLMAMGWALHVVAREGLRMQRIREHNARIDAWRAERHGGGPVGRA